MTLTEIQTLIRDVPNFPKPGITFKDITPVLKSPNAFRSLIHLMGEMIPAQATTLVAVESRGFILGSALAQAKGLGLVLVRKPGKLPYQTHSHSYELEYGQDTLHIHTDSLTRGDKIVIVDDVLATGGTAAATEALCAKTGAEVLSSCFMMELMFLKGREKLKSNARSLISL